MFERRIGHRPVLVIAALVIEAGTGMHGFGQKRKNREIHERFEFCFIVVIIIAVLVEHKRNGSSTRFEHDRHRRCRLRRRHRCRNKLLHQLVPTVNKNACIK